MFWGLVVPASGGSETRPRPPPPSALRWGRGRRDRGRLPLGAEPRRPEPRPARSRRGAREGADEKGRTPPPGRGGAVSAGTPGRVLSEGRREAAGMSVRRLRSDIPRHRCPRPAELLSAGPTWSGGPAHSSSVLARGFGARGLEKVLLSSAEEAPKRRRRCPVDDQDAHPLGPRRPTATCSQQRGGTHAL